MFYGIKEAIKATVVVPRLDPYPAVDLTIKAAKGSRIQDAGTTVMQKNFMRKIPYSQW